MLLEVHDVTKHYGPQKALDGVSVSVPKGQVVGLLGPNGAGKSTLMKSILGYLPTDGGTIAFDGTEVRDGGDAMRRRMGYLPEHNPLYPEMYVREFLDFISASAGRPGRKNRSPPAPGATSSASASLRPSCTTRSCSSSTSPPQASTRSS